MFLNYVQRWVIGIAVTLLMMVNGAYAVTYDLVLENGRVMDPETNLDAVRNVGILEGKITAVTRKKLKGKEVIDASGLVIAPGFIDLHAHGQNDIANEYQARDGVTTALEMEIGVYPVADWYASRKGKARINYGATLSHIVSRDSVVNGKEVPRKTFREALTSHAINIELSPVQAKELLTRIEEGLAEGALGVGMGIQYVPGARREEIFHIMQLTARTGVPVYVHSRITSMIEPDSIDGLQELIANAAATGSSVHFAHIGSSGAKFVPTMLEMIEGARKHGVDITTEIYPYTAASTAIGSAIFNKGWRRQIGIDYDSLQSLDDGKHLTEESFHRYRKAQPGSGVVVHFMPPEAVGYGVAHPEVMIVSDGGDWRGNRGHPRGAGSFARVLGHYVRSQKALTLMSALRKMTLLPAQRLEPAVPGMAHKGRLQRGADADITIFDPKTVIDRATYLKPMQFSKGIVHVLVDGQFVVRNEKSVEGVFPGKPIRR